MECNKDEAIRAKEIAEKKMQNNDFDGARKIALKAQALFPELENINQLLMVCNVHCAAQTRIHGSEKDLYGILQLEKFADEAIIRKQYRKLALVLHPDKNKLPGAEAAFKLISEANAVLLDPAKRSLYDTKCRVSVRTAQAKPPPHQVNRNPPASKHVRAQNNIPNGFGPQFSSLNHHQTTTSKSSVGQEAFWTYCPFCNTKYQYQKRFVNSPLRCQRCSKPFIAYDLGAQGVPSGFNSGQPGTQGGPPTSYSNQPAGSQQNIPHPGNTRTGVTTTAAFAASHLGSQGRASSRTVRSESGTTGGSTADVGGKVKTNEKDEKNNTAGGRNKGMSKVDAGKPRESGEPSNRGRKRGRKQVVESSESCDTLSSNDTDEVVQENGGNYAAGPESGVNGVHHTRRSSRHRHNVSYNENKSDDDFESPPKRLHRSKASGDSDEVKLEGISKDESKPFSTGFPTAQGDIKANMKNEGSSNPAGTFPGGISQKGKNEQASGSAGTGANNVEIIDDSESDEHSDGDSEPEVYHCPDPEFSDFDKDKEESCFAVDQIWALYDTVDGMPRFYAQIKKVFKPGFKLRINWLEADPQDDEGELVDWVEKELPFGCGRFIRGNNEDTSDRLTFSHQMQCEKGKIRGSFVIYPRKGEIWALFNDWDIKWSSDPEDGRKYKYEIVEVVSDFVEDAGVRVVYLDKVRGFVSLFHRTSLGEVDLLLIPPNELLRFSHRIPSFKMTGTEKEGVPVGSFELDPAALPTNPNDLCYPRKDNSGSLDSGKGKSVMSVSVSSPKRYADFKGSTGPNLDVSNLRRSPRGLKINEKKQNQSDASRLVS